MAARRTSTTLCRMFGPASSPPELHALEAEVMEAAWERGELAVREVMDTLNRAAPKPRAYTTYMTILARLHGKGLLDRRGDGRPDLSRPVHTREQYADLRARTEVAALVDAFGDVALGHFARQMEQLDPERRQALERLGGGDWRAPRGVARGG